MRKAIKLLLNLSMFLLAFFSFSNKSLSLTDYQIKRFCRKGKRVSLCIKNLQGKRSDLQKGKPIEIPIKPYKR
jgi:hypothetical protein